MKFFYGKHDKQFGDLYVPISDEPVPIIVVIHGGYWKDKNTLDIYPTKAIVNEYKRNCAIWNLEYRGMPETGSIALEEILSDIRSGFEYLFSLTEHNLDFSKLLIIGHSAGGHLMTWLLGEELDIRPKKAISISSVLDLNQYHLLNEPQQVEKLLNQDLNKMSLANPISRGHGATQLTVIHGLEDETVPYSMAKSYAEAWDCELILFKNCGHFSMLPLDTGEYWDSLKSIIEENVNNL
ncbi:alpha/beta hydrolase [Vibrio sinensis]|uniref:Alpha/beta hydrolase n=1 Tax=Vibrio sinensis TaxID=2302434 RepID=A0A3A6RDA9_9VIBR|nr:alpha/beta hydrolase [Vibrio sinensis]RJX75122.1 alpha/beta hydrolase [Vibrio sinensis]